MKLTFFVDSHCPLCMAEVEQLQSLDNSKQIHFEDIHASDFIQRYPHIDPVKAYRKLHGQLDNGKILLGLDVTCMAWLLVGKHRWLAILRWPVIRHFADAVYYVFARYRNVISALVMGKSCSGKCGISK
jgi:predicted DCC family thiol-disulfide oxidoreductase YuxK